MTNRLLPFFLFCTLIFFVACEKDEKLLIVDPGTCLVFVDGEFVDTELDEMPYYLDGGKDTFLLRLIHEVDYPVDARENGIQGLCIVHYEITEAGTVENIEVIEEPGGGLGIATVDALEAVTQGMSFSPGKLDGEPVRIRKEIRVRFKLE
ncbi:MAG TPA: energy transducer TonB [Saprospiraceae bacterium]|nr:energy transducer TonB [Saprospiraceae bacterium]